MSLASKLFKIIYGSGTDSISLIISLSLFLLGRTSLKSLRLRRFKSDRDEFGTIFLRQIRLDWQSVFWRDVILSRWLPWRHFTLPSTDAVAHAALCTCNSWDSAAAACDVSSWSAIVHLYLLDQRFLFLPPRSYCDRTCLFVFGWLVGPFVIHWFVTLAVTSDFHETLHGRSACAPKPLTFERSRSKFKGQNRRA